MVTAEPAKYQRHRPASVLHVIPSLGPRMGGTTTTTLQLCTALARHGVRVSLASTDLDGPVESVFGSVHRLTASTLRSTDGSSVQVECFPTIWPHRYYLSPRMATWLAEHVPQMDLVHIHSLYSFTTWWTAMQCLRANVPYIVRPHGTLAPPIRRHARIRKALHWTLFERWVFDRAAAIHYASEQERREAEQLDIRRPALVLGHGLDFAPYRVLPPRGRFRARFPWLRDGRIVLFLGRLHPIKGLNLLLEAFAISAQARHDLYLVIAGPDQGEGRSLRQRIKRLGCDHRVMFTGFVTGEEKASLLRDVDAWVLPSHTENFGVGLLEALAFGLPAIASPEVAAASLAASHQACIVVERSATRMAEAIDRVLDNPDLADRLGRNGREFVERHCGWDNIANRLALSYEAIQRRKAPMRVVTDDET